MAEASDAEHLAFATDQAWILVSQDADFLALHKRWNVEGRRHGGIMRIPPQFQGEAQISLLVKELIFYYEAEQIGAVSYENEIANQVIIL